MHSWQVCCYQVSLTQSPTARAVLTTIWLNRSERSGLTNPSRLHSSTTWNVMFWWPATLDFVLRIYHKPINTYRVLKVHISWLTLTFKEQSTVKLAGPFCNGQPYYGISSLNKEIKVPRNSSPSHFLSLALKERAPSPAQLFSIGLGKWNGTGACWSEQQEYLTSLPRE